jgi:hypothetical protein
MKKASGELDLTRFTSTAKVIENFRHWENVVALLKKEEMPPAKAKQPPAAMRAEILATLEQVLLTEARKIAGDPGVVPPRRLSNAEYDYTIQDLTGVDIRPASSFPVDPASGEGFNNTGEALTMSPGLFKKYYAAAEFVADHALLTSSGLKFAPHPVVAFADRQKYYEQAILRFYERHAVEYEKYLTELWLYRHRPPSQKTVTFEDYARDNDLSPKYARSLWNVLQDDASKDKFFLHWLRQHWHALPPPRNPMAPTAGEILPAARTLAAAIQGLSRQLCSPETPAIVPNAGNGPIDHLARRRRTAESRDQLDRNALKNPRFSLTFPNERKPPAGERSEPSRPSIDLKQPASPEVEASGEAFCRLFPNRFYYVDATRGLSAGFHLIEGFFRDDRPLYRHVLNDQEKQELDRLWDELYFVTGIWEKMLRGFVFFERSERNFLKHPDFDSFKEEDPQLVKDDVLARFQAVYLKRSNVKTTGAERAKHPVNVFFGDIRAGLRRHADTLKRAETTYLRDLQAFAEAAYRRPPTDREKQKLEKFYTEVCRDKDHGVEAAVRASIVRVLVSPHFCYHLGVPPPGDSIAPLSDLALASRLSYFIWSSMPDEKLLALAESGKLRDERVLREQVRRMLQDPKVSRFALEFFGQWLGYRDFPRQEAVDRRVFPAFDDALKQAMYEEPTRLITHLIQRERPISDLLDGDATLVNKRLAQHYGLPFRGKSGAWELVDGLHERGRGGVLGMAVILTKNSQPQRTSPVKRGFWVVHKLLGEHIPPPPPDVAVLPAKETATEGKTIRQLMARHTDDRSCARCHQRFDPIGLSMEGFDPIGRNRAKDWAGRPIDNVVLLPSGKEARGVPEFGRYLATHRQQDFTRTLCRKFLSYALGRSLQLSDQPLLEKMQTELTAQGSRLSTLFDLVATSAQFGKQRCRDFTPSRFQSEVQGVEK